MPAKPDAYVPPEEARHEGYLEIEYRKEPMGPWIKTLTPLSLAALRDHFADAQPDFFGRKKIPIQQGNDHILQWIVVDELKVGNLTWTSSNGWTPDPDA